MPHNHVISVIGLTNVIKTISIACREACKLDAKYITNFGEEVVRGQPVFVLSILLQKLEPMLRQAAGVAPWQVSLLLQLHRRPSVVKSSEFV